MSVRTKYPVVLVHGACGFGKEYPAWRHFSPYWPEGEIGKLNPNHIIVDVGPISSDHDRACETFYQLFGGTVDYGQQHAEACNHRRYGEHYHRGLHPNWSADNPLHLVGHSMGATTSIELYQLLCTDFFNVGSNASWIRSITSIAGPLSGSTLFHLYGVNAEQPLFSRYSFAHIFSAACFSIYKLYRRFSSLQGIFNLHLNHWDDLSLRQLCTTDLALHTNADFAMFQSLPMYRMEKNKKLQSMQKIHLLSIVTASTSSHFPVQDAVLAAILCLLLAIRRPRSGYKRALVISCFVYHLYGRLRKIDLAQVPSLHGYIWLMRRYVQSLPSIFDGFKQDLWAESDGLVNIQSMLRPWFPKPKDMSRAMDMAAETIPISTSSSSLYESEMARNASHVSIDQIDGEGETVARFQRGRWYVYRVDGNHFRGTWWDGGAKDLYESLFILLQRECEGTTAMEQKLEITASIA